MRGRNGRERFEGNDKEFEQLTRQNYFDKSTMEKLPSHAIVMHPWPRSGEIAKEVDEDRRAAYFR